MADRDSMVDDSYEDRPRDGRGRSSRLSRELLEEVREAEYREEAPRRHQMPPPDEEYPEAEDGAWMVGRKRLAQSLMLEEQGPGGGSRLISLFIIFFVAAFLVWSSFTRITEVVVSSGEVSPLGSVKEVQHLEGGIVADIKVHEGDTVTENQVIVELEASTTQPELEQMRTRLAGLQLEANQLGAVMRGQSPDSTKGDPRYQNLANTQTEVFEAKLKSQKAQLDVITKQIAQKREESAFLREQERAIKRQIGFVAEEVEMRKSLLEKGLMPKVVMLENQRELARTQSQLAEIKGQQRRNNEGISELVSRKAEINARMSMEAAENFGKIKNEIAELRDAISLVEGRVQRLQIRSPVTGRIQTLNTKTVGGVVAPGSTVAEIIPNDAELIVESRVTTQDIGFIYSGQEARVKVSAFDFTRYGDVIGKIVRISATTFEDEKTKDPYYKIHIRLDRNFVGNDPKRNIIVPGMTVTADIRTGEKTLAEYLLKPIYKAMSEAFRER